MTHAERFVEAYTKNWQDPDANRFPEFYHPEGKMLNPGMEQPISRPHIGGYYARMLALIPDLRLERKAWSATGDLLFIEWMSRGTVLGQQFEVRVIDRIILKDELIIDGRGYFDSAVVQSIINPGTQSSSLLG